MQERLDELVLLLVLTPQGLQFLHRCGAVDRYQLRFQFQKRLPQFQVGSLKLLVFLLLELVALGQHFNFRSEIFLLEGSVRGDGLVELVKQVSLL
jgi:hypothetical protein